MPNFDFTTCIKNNDIIKEHETCASTIYMDIIYTSDESAVIEFNKLGIFLLLVYAGDKKVDIIHHVMPSTMSIITK